MQLAGFIPQRDQSSSADAAESCVFHPLQPAAALSDLPVVLPGGLVQLQPAALLERRLPAWYEAASASYSLQSVSLSSFNRTKWPLVALNYQTEGRVLQLNRAKFYSNGNCGYLLKPASMCEGPTPVYPRKLFSIKSPRMCILVRFHFKQVTLIPTWRILSQVR